MIKTDSTLRLLENYFIFINMICIMLIWSLVDNTVEATCITYMCIMLILSVVYDKINHYFNDRIHYMLNESVLDINKYLLIW